QPGRSWGNAFGEAGKPHPVRASRGISGGFRAALYGLGRADRCTERPARSDARIAACAESGGRRGRSSFHLGSPGIFSPKLGLGEDTAVRAGRENQAGLKFGPTQSMTGSAPRLFEGGTWNPISGRFV